jgi:hypothetical protein
LNDGDQFIGSQSPAESLSIKGRIDTERGDKRHLAANGLIGYIATMVAGSLDLTIAFPGGEAIDVAKGGLTFTKVGH